MRIDLHHELTTESVISACGVPGHYDTIIKCSCGFETRLSHESQGGRVVDRNIFYHRLDALEKATGITFVVNGG